MSKSLLSVVMVVSMTCTIISIQFFAGRRRRLDFSAGVRFISDDHQRAHVILMQKKWQEVVSADMFQVSPIHTRLLVFILECTERNYHIH